MLFCTRGMITFENNLNFTLSICPENNDARQLLDEISGKEFNEDPRLFNVEKKVNLFLKNCRSQLTSLARRIKRYLSILRKGEMPGKGDIDEFS